MTVDLSIVVPLYNEEKTVLAFLERLYPVVNQLKITFEVIFCLDPSSDQTEAIVTARIEQDPNIKLITFSRRFGQPAATMAGLFYCQGKYAVVIDVDLQDPPELIADLFAKAQEGYEVVYAKRRSRKGETLLKRFISYLGYNVINKCSDIEIPRNTGDFRILSRRVINQLKSLNESHGFLRGLVAYVGFKQTFIEYDRDERFAGRGSYNRFTGSLKIGMNGLISFSSRPLQLMSITGAIVAGFSFLLGAWYVIQKLIGFSLTPGLSTTVLVVSFFAGVQLLCLGLMGEYIGRIYDEVKRRPMFIIDRVISKNG